MVIYLYYVHRGIIFRMTSCRGLVIKSVYGGERIGMQETIGRGTPTRNLNEHYTNKNELI